LPFALCAVLAAGSARAAPARPLLIVGEENPPFEFTQDGRPRGINSDVVAQVFKTLGVPYEIRLYPWPRALAMMENGRADALLSVSYNPQREAFLLFTEEQKVRGSALQTPDDFLWVSDYALFYNRRYESSLRFDSLEQVRRDRYRVGINKDYSYTPAFFAAGLSLVTNVTVADCFRALLEGNTDVYCCDRTAGAAVLQKMGASREIAAFPKTVIAKPYLLGFSRISGYPGIGEVMTRFYAELRRLRDSGEYLRLYRQYVPEASGVGPTRPLLFVCEDWVPFEYLDENGQLAGLDVEVVARIMGKLGTPYQIRIYPWTRACMLIEKGKADAVLSVSYNVSREPLLYYTDEQRRYAQTGELPPDYLWLSEYVFFVKTKDADHYRFESYEQLRTDQYRIGVNKDYTYDPAFMAAHLNTVAYSSARDGFNALVTDEIQLYPMDKTVGLATLKEMGLAGSVTYLPRPLFTKPYLAPFCRKSDYPGLPQLMAAFYAELQTMRTNGEYQVLYRKHCGDTPPPP
jgi:polar amino acid transport system substrate-binding protein